MSDERDHYAHGVHRLALGDLTGAEAYFKAVGPESAAYRDAQLRLGRLLLDTERPGAAEVAAQRALKAESDAPAWMLLGEALLAQERAMEAQAAFAQAARLTPTSPEPWILAGHAHVAMEQAPAGIRAYEEALVRDNKHVAARYYLAEALVRAGDIVRASTQLHYVQHLEPRYVPAILLRGDIAFHQKDYRQAIVEYCHAIDQGTVGADVYQRLADAFLAIDDPEQALKAYEKAVQLAPEAWACHLAAAKLHEARKRMPQARRHYAAIAYVPECSQEATAGMARVDAHMAMFDLSEKPEASPTPAADTFEAPEVLRRQAPVKGSGTRPLGAPIPPPPTGTRPLPSLPPLPKAPSGRLKGSSSQSGPLPGERKPTRPPDH
jgi:cytochrome c-type biogenesis protein CcmH/NrfG